MANIDGLLRYLKDCGGSDLHLAAGLSPRVRIGGILEPVPGAGVLSDENLRPVLHEILSQAHWEQFQANLDLDFAYVLDGVGRYRVNYFNQENGVSAVFRVFPTTIPTLSALSLPPIVESLCHLPSGLILITGVAGSGVSTTIAAMLSCINAAYDKHIVTVEEPVEFIHEPRQCMISQRDVGSHAKSFSDALRAALRQNPDVIMLSSMASRATVELATMAAEMGVLVIGAMHTSGVARTVSELLDLLPGQESQSARISLSQSLVAIVAQQLLRTADGKGRCPANEVLTWTPALPDAILRGHIERIGEMIRAGADRGMQAMDDALVALVQDGRILPRDAYLKAEDRSRFEALV